MSADWVSFVISAIYLFILLGCLLGIRMNMMKRNKLILHNELDKQARVIRWKFRFYGTLLFASLLRIGGIIGAVIVNTKLTIEKATTQKEFVWQMFASIASLLYYSSFSFIIWFFAHLAYHQQLNIKKYITPILTTVNVGLYISTITLGIASIASSEWTLLYDVEIPLFALSAWILSIGFLLLSCKITSRVHEERRETIDYMEYSRQHRQSITHSRQQALIKNKRNNNNKHQSNGGIGAIGGDNEQSMSMNRSNQYQAQLPPMPMPTPNQYEQQQQQQNEQQSAPSSHIIGRLVKLSIVCSLCWFVRGLYVIALRIWPSTDKTPFGIPVLAWEAIFYCLTEFPPSLGALILMISKPKRQKYANNISMHEPEYPAAKDYQANE